ncbi:MAG TPA: acyl-CoA dehydrogenase family protein [Desulfatiglandales bacterium]|nr:acyl-CoA dehydrogenase family protein [Desulfatiglandales bacterium]
MAGTKLFKGGEFLVADALPEEVFTPEDFNEEQKLIAKSAEEFGLGEIVSRKEELDQLNPDLLRSLIKKAGELGFLGGDIPELYEGSGLDKISVALITEYISQGVTAFSVTYAVQTGIGSLPIVFFGTPEQKKKYLPGLATGEMIGAYALTESEHGSDALNAEATAVLSEDGRYYILNGQKQFITNAGFADLFLTYAQVDGKLFTSFIVERAWGGVSVDEEEKKMGVHGTSTRAVIFQDVRVPVENVLGEAGRGHVVALNTLNVGRYKLGAFMVGGAKVLIAESVKYAKGRRQFGKPICEFGLIKHKIAEMIIRTYVAESMVYRTAGLLDLTLKDIDPTKGDAGRKTGEALREYALECSINKVYSSEMLEFVADQCVQIMGGYGYIQEYPAESAYRDSRINPIWEGTNEINRLVIVDTIMRTAMKGNLPLLQAFKNVAEELLTYRPSMNEEDNILEKERRMVAMAKKITLLAAGAATKKYMDKLSSEQEIIALIADSIIEIFAMESALLRALKKFGKDGEEKAGLHIAATQVYINDSFQKVDIMAKQIFAGVFEGEELRTGLMGLKKFSRFVPANNIALRREIADIIIPVARYNLTKI